MGKHTTIMRKLILGAVLLTALSSCTKDNEYYLDGKYLADYDVNEYNGNFFESVDTTFEDAVRIRFIGEKMFTYMLSDEHFMLRAPAVILGINYSNSSEFDIQYLDGGSVLIGHFDEDHWIWADVWVVEGDRLTRYTDWPEPYAVHQEHTIVLE